MCYKKFAFLLITLFAINTSFLFGQSHALLEHTKHEQKDIIESKVKPHNVFPHFRGAVFISHTFIPSIAKGERIAIPSYGLDLEYWFNHDWGLGLHNDLELETFIIEQDHEEFLEREYPLVSTLDLLYRPWKGIVFQIGPGIEIDRNKTFYLLRLGVEYEIELGHHWDLYPTFFYDTREDAYTTISVGLGVGKRF